MLLAFAPDFMDRETFVCGPPGYVEMVRGTLERLGYPMHRYHQESFGSGPAAAVPPVVRPSKQEPEPQAAAEPPPITRPVIAAAEIVFEKSGMTVNCANGDLILEVAEENGLALGSSCRAGVCGVCKVRKTEGVVSMDGQTALNDWDIEDGYVLPCVGAVHGRVVIDA